MSATDNQFHSEPETISLTVNGQQRSVNAGNFETLLTVLRDQLDMTGTKRGCNQGVCGACTVLVDGKPVRSCLSLAANCASCAIDTIEGVANNDKLVPVQQALIEENAVQCGFCTSGMVMTAHAFLQQNPNPSIDEIRGALSGNICRCSGYRAIVNAVARAATTEGS